jgi:hypothetical protein
VASGTQNKCFLRSPGWAENYHKSAWSTPTGNGVSHSPVAYRGDRSSDIISHRVGLVIWSGMDPNQGMAALYCGLRNWPISFEFAITDINASHSSNHNSLIAEL